MGKRSHTAGKLTRGAHTTLIDAAALPVKVLQQFGIAVAPLRIEMGLRKGAQRFTLTDYGDGHWRLFVRGTSSRQELLLRGGELSFTQLTEQFLAHKKIIKSGVGVGVREVG